ncbi:hypothetical protein P0F40_003296 [Vibrio metschnikovii]|uniref:Uncharacterized protein n=2 Tax=Unclassified Bacteria TaxID=49928 RepID=A0AAU6UX58_UNCXX|nr:hypothetical protein [Vibrio metschnikovii]EKO3594348.1 hypothetical protein [Vibrio metschnikovii]EKO3667663.1 hypothetical protein [Vibrio metschnikovii]EKO3698696.1 hypothetical protein [Vibrio metschnikovii]EKO3719119.1 hypothetical protein [Vibrio metschnikovii]
MNSSLSVPTDNPYKLMAIVGAVIFVFSLYFLLRQTYVYNDIVFQAAEKISIIEAQDELPDSVKKDRILIENRKIEIVSKDRKFFPYLCGLIAALGCFLCGIGFRHWIFEVYPDEEAIRKEQLKSLRLANKAASKMRLGKRT